MSSSARDGGASMAGVCAQSGVRRASERSFRACFVVSPVPRAMALVCKYATASPALVLLVANKYNTNPELAIKFVASKNLAAGTPAELIFPASGYATIPCVVVCSRS